MSKVITEAAQALVSVEQAPMTIEIEKGALRKYAMAIAWPEKPDARYVDGSGGVIAPPTFCTSFHWLAPLLEKINPSMPAYRVALNGGNEYEFYEPIRAGDALTARPKLASLSEKPRDDGGVMLIIDLEAEFTNQTGARVLTARQRLLRIYGPENLT